MAEQFGYSVSTINYNLKQIDESREIHLSDAIRKIRTPSDKWEEQGVLMYNLNVVIAVGYRVNSYETTRYRFWAMQMLSMIPAMVNRNAPGKKGGKSFNATPIKNRRPPKPYRLGSRL